MKEDKFYVLSLGEWKTKIRVHQGAIFSKNLTTGEVFATIIIEDGVELNIREDKIEEV